MRRGDPRGRPFDTHRTPCYASVGRGACVCRRHHAQHPQRRGTLAPPYRRFTNVVGVGVPDDPPQAPHASVGRGALAPPPTCAAPPTLRRGDLRGRLFDTHSTLTGGARAPYRRFTDFVGDNDPVSVPKIFALPYGGRLKF